MNQTFSPSRFGRLLRKYVTDNRGQLLVGLALVSGIMLIGLVLIYSEIPPVVENVRLPVAVIFGWAVWYVFIWLQTDILNQKERAMTYLLQPASQFEKVLLIGVVSGLGFVLVYVALFTVFDAVGVAFVNQREWTAAQLEEIKARDGALKLTPFLLADRQTFGPLILWAFTALLHPFALVLLLLVRRYNFALVAVLTFVLVAFIFWLNMRLGNWLMHTNGQIAGTSPFDGLSIRSPDLKTYRFIRLPQPIGDQLRYAVVIALMALLYVTAYFRLKEREV